MTKITLTPPSVGEKNTAAEPKVGTAIKEVETWLNGQKIESTDNIKPEGIAEASLSKALQEKLTSRVGLKLEVKNESLTAVSENFYEMQKEGSTLTLPAPTLNRITGAFCTGGIKEIKVTASSGKIYGDFVTGSTTVVLNEYQHILVQADGSNWLILAGEPKREQTYSGFTAYTKAQTEAGVEPSATRPALVNVVTTEAAVSGRAINVGLKIAGQLFTNTQTSIFVPPGVKWSIGTGTVVEASTITL